MPNPKPILKNSLAACFPDLVKQWHPAKNDMLTPDQVATKPNKKCWWKCPKGPDHEWEATVTNRASGGGCPFCRGRRVSVTNSLAALYPDIASQWHPTKNGNLTPEQVVAGSGKMYWWKCSKGPDHEWEATLDNRTSGGKGCPFCRGLKASVTNCLASLYPDIASQWHPTRNGDFTPDQIVAGSGKMYWWKCPKGPDHEWEATAGDRTSGNGCPFCRGFRAYPTT
jgi:hypothetical protein